MSLNKIKEIEKKILKRIWHLFVTHQPDSELDVFNQKI